MAEQEESKKPFLKKAERQACWGARDRFWACLDATNQDQDKCKKVFFFLILHSHFVSEIVCSMKQIMMKLKKIQNYACYASWFVVAKWLTRLCKRRISNMS